MSLSWPPVAAPHLGLWAMGGPHVFSLHSAWSAPQTEAGRHAHDRPHTTKTMNRTCSQPYIHASPRHKRGPSHRPAQTYLPQVCETCVGTLRQTHRSHRPDPHTHTTLRHRNPSLPSDLGHGPPQPALPEDNASLTPRCTQEPLSAWRGREGTSSQAPSRLAPSRGGSWQHLPPASSCMSL